MSKKQNEKPDFYFVFSNVGKLGAARVCDEVREKGNEKMIFLIFSVALCAVFAIFALVNHQVSILYIRRIDYEKKSDDGIFCFRMGIHAECPEFSFDRGGDVAPLDA